MIGPPILTAAAMRAAEAGAIASGIPETALMERAGRVAAEATWRFAGSLPALVVCGPGNNGGDGYVIARALAKRGVGVRVAALGPPRAEAARWAAAQWTGPVEQLADAPPAPLLIDAMFGTGLARPLDAPVAEELGRLAGGALVRVAVDLPSGVSSDDGAILSPVPEFDLTVTFATLKPSHLLQPAARRMGRLVVADIGIEAASPLTGIARPRIAPPGPDDHKYTRGYVAVLAGEMPGAAALAAHAAIRAGAGYVSLSASSPVPGVPSALVQGRDLALEDRRIGAIVVGPGLGRDASAAGRLDRLLAGDRPLVLDADALRLIEHPERLRRRHAPTILTPHGGEFERLFGARSGSKLDRACEGATRSGAIILLKGADTVIAAPDGRGVIAPTAPAWLATAGTGDVLAGIVAAMLAGGREPLEAAAAAVWLHGRAAAVAGAALIADDLIAALPLVLAECL